jgi:hypothetical protein
MRPFLIRQPALLFGQQPQVVYCFLQHLHRRLDAVQAAGSLDGAAHGFQAIACHQHHHALRWVYAHRPERPNPVAGHLRGDVVGQRVRRRSDRGLALVP